MALGDGFYHEVRAVADVGERTEEYRSDGDCLQKNLRNACYKRNAATDSGRPLARLWNATAVGVLSGNELRAPVEK